MNENDIAVIAEPSYELYQDCSEIPLYNWIKLAVTANHKWLIKSGKTEDDLSEAYEAIFTEYTSLVKDVRSTQELRLKIAITSLANRIDQVKLCVSHLRFERDEKLIEILRNDLGFYRLAYDDLDKDLNLTETLMRTDTIKFEQKKQQYEKMVGDVSDSGNGEVDFYEQVQVLSKWLGFSINPKNTSLMQYIVYLNALKLEIKNSQIK